MQSARWVELVLRVPEARVETVSDALQALDALSVTVEDADADTEAEQALFGEPGLPPPAAGWRHSRVAALFDTPAQAREAAALLQVQDFFADSVIEGLRPVADTDWVRLTQSQFEPVPITADFWIVPSWHEPPAGAHTVIRLDPGLAFGTGTHPTTRMCLRWIATHGMAGRRVLDYGCGSGILAIAAAKFGASAVDAVDIDPAAVAATQANAAANAVNVRAGLPEAVNATYDVVLANILATPLKVLAPLLCAQVASTGHLVLAGILERQADELRAAYAPWVTLQVHDAVDGWILMTAQRT
ncbi:50S ribosomal protein L11 methyltransferase [Tepidimonas charontis]|uniref:Ribosomal protein L11 methyltransferase n=1 Tax=Tepidimonas charontis TaxID=2267262 RepID=A0A554X2P1_9BURK|nr:50S ribosomal protein L11 methyltransferase [Tepidimonas charontis]TSE30110.1 Ribosomal protein L11 methyltransferase [Tepidimonas charontis]